ARALAHQRLQLRDRLLDLRLPPAARRDAAVGLLELAERLLQLAPQPRGERQVVEALGLVALPPEGEAGQALRFFGVGVEAQRTLALAERRAALVQVRERLAVLGVREGVLARRRAGARGPAGVLSFCAFIVVSTCETRSSVTGWVSM